MIVSVSKELCLGSLRNASVVYIMVNWVLIWDEVPTMVEIAIF